MKKLMIALTVMITLSASIAQACSMAPVDMKVQAADMERFALTALNVDSSRVDDVFVSDAKGSYIWTDPMCPEGIKAKAIFTVSFDSDLDPFARGCTGVVLVEKTAPTRLSRIKVDHKYSVKILQQAICLE